jgi:hypothetical protein
MKARTGVLVFLAIVSIGYGAWGKIPAPIFAPPEVRITPPSPDLAAELAAFSGIWEDTQDGVLPSRLVIEKIHGNWATIVYVWADHPTGSFKGGWERVRAKVLPDGKLHWGYPGRFTVEIAKDGTSIEGTKEQAGRSSTFTMRKVWPFVAQSPHSDKN